MTRSVDPKSTKRFSNAKKKIAKIKCRSASKFRFDGENRISSISYATRRRYALAVIDLHSRAVAFKPYARFLPSRSLTLASLRSCHREFSAFDSWNHNCHGVLMNFQASAGLLDFFSLLQISVLISYWCLNWKQFCVFNCKCFLFSLPD